VNNRLENIIDLKKYPIQDLNSPLMKDLIKKCKTKWCKIATGGYSGWIFKSSLWGKIK